MSADRGGSMKEYTILTVNPGSTGTKLGLVRGDVILLDLNVDTPKGMFADCPRFGDQVPKREQMIWICSMRQMSIWNLSTQYPAEA